ncbi:MAG: type II toxin-antitoxin system RelE/ParE family toxin [Treponema sp.]|jgi:putative addiction module killer protein|nr:type II toxin-antitoxin system RelE/ParE family toxin [Treponema sp.]
MYDIELTDEFDNWLRGLTDSKIQKIIIKRIRTMSLGSLGEVRSLNDGLFEAKIRYGQGYRLYFVNHGKRIIIMLCGGNKSTQNKDIIKARNMAKDLI